MNYKIMGLEKEREWLAMYRIKQGNHNYAKGMHNALMFWKDSKLLTQDGKNRICDLTPGQKSREFMNQLGLPNEARLLSSTFCRDHIRDIGGIDPVIIESTWLTGGTFQEDLVRIHQESMTFQRVIGGR